MSPAEIANAVVLTWAMFGAFASGVSYAHGYGKVFGIAVMFLGPIGWIVTLWRAVA